MLLTDLRHGLHPERVIFLDVDGPLVTSETLGNGRTERHPWKMVAQINPPCAAVVVRIVRATGCRIVVSSTIRRYDKQMTGLRRALMNAGLTREEVRRTGADMAGFSVTPWLANEYQGANCRTQEIKAWLAEHPEVTRYVVVDDCPTGLVQVRPMAHEGGLLDRHGDVAIQILTKRENDEY